MLSTFKLGDRKMVLAVDVGNTNIAIGVFDADTPAFMAKISTVTSATEDEYAIKLMDIRRRAQIRLHSPSRTTARRKK